MERSKWADRGQQLRVGPSEHQWVRCLGVSRLGGIEVSGNELSIWFQVRGGSWVEAKEGRFYLREGDWIAFAKDSRPAIQADQDGICIGLTVADEAIGAMGRFSDFGLYVGHGRIPRAELRATARLWYQASRRLDEAVDATRLQGPPRTLLLHLARVQSEFESKVLDCPGGSLGRKRQVFERMQRARLYMEGHCHRVVRIGELAERTQFSTWYFSKIFLRVYGETPQLASGRMRLARAADLLASTAMTIGEVGVASGFENVCSFARSFRARFGMTASDYRNASQRLGQIGQMCGTNRATHIATERRPVRFARKTRSFALQHNVGERLTRS